MGRDGQMSLLEEIMKKRGFSEDFLMPEYGGFGELPDVKVAAERIILAKERGEKVMIYGDYDADGVTASTVMNETLKMVGVEVAEIMLPDRFKDGYGMSERLVGRAKELGVGLVITVDCGSGNYEIIEKLKEAGIETIVTDHHECLKELPPAVAVVNPKRRDVEVAEDLQHLAGVGVAFMVAYELMKMGAIREGQEKWLLDLVVIGTICDSMVMTGTNRVLGYYGMKVMEKTRRPGLMEMLARAQVKKVDAGTIGFRIGPRINAAGRMKSADLALKLMMTESRVEAARLAEELEGLNQQRKAEQERAAREIAERGVGEEKVLVEVGEWHEGVLGIIAGHLTEDYRRPAFALAKVGEVVKGSGRSFGEFSLAEALAHCEGVIIGGGGHAGACGVKLLPEKVDDFRKVVNDYYESLGLRGQEKYLEVEPDLKLRNFKELTIEEVEMLSKLEPYGEGNYEPVFLLSGTVVEARTMGAEGQHLKIRLRGDDGGVIEAVAFFAPEDWMGVNYGDRVGVKVHLTLNEWQGVNTVQGQILEMGGGRVMKATQCRAERR